jgi:hypothetical protein
MPNRAPMQDRTSPHPSPFVQSLQVSDAREQFDMGDNDD